MTAIYKRELKAYTCNMYAAVYMTVFLAFLGVCVTLFNLRGDNGTGGYPNLEYALSQTQLVLVFVIPILTMRSVAEDKRTKNDAFLLSLPVKPSGIILGKYLALLTVFSAPIALTCLYPLLLNAFSESGVNFGATYASILAFWLLGAALIAVCMFISSLTENMIVSAVIGIAAVGILYLADVFAYLIPDAKIVSFICFVVVAFLLALAAFGFTKSLNICMITAAVLIIPLSVTYMLTSDSFEGLFPEIVSKFGLFTRFDYFVNGIFDLTTIALYLSIAVFFIILTIQQLDRKRWN